MFWSLFALVAAWQGPTMIRRLIYHPSHYTLAEATPRAASVGAEPWRGPDGEVWGWRWPRPEAPGVALAFHGNGGAALDRGYLAATLGSPRLAGGWEVIVVEYPGYGARGGAPSEAAFFRAATQALDTLRAADPRPIIAVGESIGTGTASHLAGARPEEVAAVLLITPFIDLADVAAVHYPILPVRMLLPDRFDNAAALARYRGPVAILLAGQDEVVPTASGERLFERYNGPKRKWIDPGASHNALAYDPTLPRWAEIAGFLRENPR